MKDVSPSDIRLILLIPLVLLVKLTSLQNILENSILSRKPLEV